MAYDWPVLVISSRRASIDLTGGLVISAFAPSWSDEDWRDFCETALRVPGRGHRRAFIVYSPMSGPTAAQRQLLSEEYGLRLGVNELRHNVVLTESKLVIGVSTAFSWLSMGKRKFRGFAPAAHLGALRWLAEVSQFDQEVALATLRDAIAAVGYRGDALTSGRSAREHRT